MELKLASEVVDGVTVITPDGRIVFGPEAALLRESVKLAIDATKKVLLDLRKVSYIDSGGLGTLVSLHTSAHTAGGDMKLSGLSTRVIGLLQVTKLLTVFDVHESLESGLASFR